MIPIEHKDALVDASVHLMRALANAYGSDKAMEFWTTLSDTIDQDLKGLTFAAMLTGRSGGGLLTITHINPGYDRVLLIKYIRTWDRRKLGLKEALDLYNGLRDRNIPMKLEVDYDKIDAAKTEFSNLGCRGVNL